MYQVELTEPSSIYVSRIVGNVELEWFYVYEQ